MSEITLKDGPFDGAKVEASDPRTPLLCTGDPVPEGMVARYGPTREPGIFRFREYDRIIVRLPVERNE